MNQILNILVLIGGIFLALFCVLDPLQGATLLIVAFPFGAVIVFLNLQNRRLRQKIGALTTETQSDKEALSRELRKLEQVHREQMERVRTYSQELALAGSKDELLRTLVKTIAKATHSAAGDSQVFLLSHIPGTDEFTYEMGDNFDSTMLRAERFSAKDELLQNVIHGRQIYTVISDMFGVDSQAQYFLKEDRMAYMSQISSLSLLPLIMENEIWGIVVVFCREDAAARIRNHLEFFTLLLAQSSVALAGAIHRGLASVDRLTQLYNRNFLQKRFVEEIEFCNRQRLPLSVLIIDIDHFKSINDNYGHQEGDVVLKTIAQIIAKNVRLTDICARYGGEEFIVILPGIEEKPSDRFSIAERLRAAVEKTEFFVLGDKLLQVTISVGVSVRHYPQDKDISEEELFRRADELLYMAKRSGRNRVCYPQPQDDAAQERQ